MTEAALKQMPEWVDGQTNRDRIEPAVSEQGADPVDLHHYSVARRRRLVPLTRGQ